MKKLRARSGYLNNIVGYLGELIVILLLKIKLQSILHHRYRTPIGEIDIISCRGGTIFFTEVKSSVASSCFEDIPISTRQRKSIVRAAKYFTSCNPKFNNYQMIFNVCCISPRSGITWIENAWSDEAS